MGRVLGLMGLAVLTMFMTNKAEADGLTLEQVDGTVYTDVTVKRSTPTTLSFQHAGGIASVPSGSLTDESLSKLGLNPEDNPDFKEQREGMALKENLRMLKKNHQVIPGGVGTGQSIKTKDITDINPISILITEDGVPRRVELSTLPKDVQTELGYDPVKAAEYTKAKSQAEMAASMDAAKLKMAQDKKDADMQKQRAAADKKAADDAAKASKTATKDDPNKFNALQPITK